MFNYTPIKLEIKIKMAMPCPKRKKKKKLTENICVVFVGFNGNPKAGSGRRKRPDPCLGNVLPLL